MEHNTQTRNTTAPALLWADILKEAVTRPGLISDAYNAFWSYSRGNQLAAMVQCHARGLEIGPLDTFGGWMNKGRTVKKGEKALFLCMPVEMKSKADSDESETPDAGDTVEKPATRRYFVWRPNWFTYAQTEGEEMLTPEPPAIRWNKGQALAALGIQQVPFTHTDGNCQGFANIENGGKVVAVNPVAALPHKTLFHEIAHIVLGHLERGQLSDGEELGRHIRELEAECVAYIICESFGLPGGDYSRGYIQHWYQGDTVPEKSARRIFNAADRIIKAGEPIE